jgi:hypothetical protein
VKTGRSQRFLILALLIPIGAIIPMAALSESVDITLPTTVSFGVRDIANNTTGSPNPTTISFVDAQLASGRALRISVKADAIGFTPPSGAAIPVSYVSWTTSGAAGGSGSNGSLSFVTYNQVYQSNIDPVTGSVDISWSLAPTDPGVYAGEHILTLRWKLESVTP